MKKSLLWKVEKSKSVIKSALERFRNPCVVWSGGKDSTLMLYLVIDVVKENGFEMPWVSTCIEPLPFEENMEFQRKIVEKLGLKKVIWYKDVVKDEFYKKAGEIGKDKKKCCFWLKVMPLNNLIEKYKIDALFVGIRWDEHPERAKEVYFSPRENPKHIRVHPILHWSWLDVWEYTKERNLPVNPLYFKGYTSLGCKCCTTIAKKGGFKDLDEIIAFIRSKRVQERAGRDIDKERVMEALRRLGYF